MANLTSALQQLREERKQAQYQIKILDLGISVLEDLVKERFASTDRWGEEVGL
jgi:hypothetical protein